MYIEIDNPNGAGLCGWLTPTAWGIPRFHPIFYESEGGVAGLWVHSQYAKGLGSGSAPRLGVCLVSSPYLLLIIIFVSTGGGGNVSLIVSDCRGGGGGAAGRERETP